MRVQIVALAFLLTLVGAPAEPQDGVDALPKVIQHSQPIYPPLARQARIQGDVRVRLTTDGESITNLEAVAGQPLLRKAAEDNVRTWRFAPHRPSTFYVVFRYKLASGDVDVEFLDAPSLVQLEAAPPQTIIDYAWIGLGKWKAQLVSAHGKCRRTLDLSYSGPDGEWLRGKVLGEKGEDEEIDFGHKEGDFVAFTAKLREPDGKRLVTFFVGNLKGNRITGTFVDGAGATGHWTALRMPEDAKSR